jgi:hypothetical protein
MTSAVVQVPAPPRGLEPPPAAPPPPPPSPAATPAVAATATPTQVPGPADAPKRGALAGWVVALLALAGLAAVWSMVAELHRASLAIKAADEGGVSLQQLGDADDGVASAVGAEIGALLVAGILFIIWLYRLCKRLQAARPDSFRYNVGWAIGGWFVPIWSLFRPKQMVDDAWRAADRWQGVAPRVPGWVHLWWAAWIVSSLLSWGVSRQYGDDTLHGIATADRVAAVGDGITVVAAALAIALVWTLSRRAAEVPATAAASVPTSSAYRFNPPPGWPVPPEGWVPPPNWQPDPSWPPPPMGWQLWVPR